MKASSKKLSITLPQELNRELNTLAKKEHRTLSSVLQEASRYYLNNRNYEVIQQELAQRARKLGIINESDVEKLIEEVRKGV